MCAPNFVSLDTVSSALTVRASGFIISPMKALGDRVTTSKEEPWLTKLVKAIG